MEYAAGTGFHRGLSCCAVSFTPPPDFRGAVLLAAAVVSPATVMAVNYGNNEMLIFAMAIAGCSLWTGRRSGRLSAYAVFFLTAMLKYFPIVLLCLALRERSKRVAILAAAIMLMLAVFGFTAAEQIRLSFLNVYTMSPFSYLFGVKNISELAMRMNLASPSLAVIIRLLLTLAVVTTAWFLSNRLRAQGVMERLDLDHRAFLLVGGLLILAAYFSTQNVAYRQIHMLMALPGLLAVSRNEGGRWAGLPPLAVVLMYLFPLRIHAAGLFVDGGFVWGAVSLFGVLAREVAWLILATGLLALIFAGLRELSGSVQIENGIRRFGTQSKKRLSRHTPG